MSSKISPQTGFIPITQGTGSECCYFAHSPRDMLLEILKLIKIPSDVAKVNLICKGLKNLNEGAVLSKYRIQALSNSNQSCLDAAKPYTFADYIKSVQEFRRSMNEARLLAHLATNGECLSMIHKQFPAASNEKAALVPVANVVEYLVSLFTKMRPDFQLEAFLVVLKAENSTDAIAKQFYNALSEEMQTEFKGQIWTALNGNRYFCGIDNEEFFVSQIIANAIRGPFAKKAAEQYHANLRFSALIRT
jgi:hypothetical protein